MTTPKPRSAFLPVMLIVVGLVIVAGVVVFYVPVMECEACFGAGIISEEEEIEALVLMRNERSYIESLVTEPWQCMWCMETGKTTVLRKYTEDPPVGLDFRGGGSRLEQRSSIRASRERACRAGLGLRVGTA